MKALLLSILTAATVSSSPAAETTKAAGESINAFGLALHLRLAAEGGNVVASPWSIETALAMTYAGADGRTKAEMAKVLRFSAAEDSVHEGLRGIAADLSVRAANSLGRVKRSKEQGGPSSPLEIQVANRLFGLQGYSFRAPFLYLAEKTYGAPLEFLDFKKNAEGARKHINGWVEEQTKQRIKELIPPGVLNEFTRLVLTNAVYLKAPWAQEFGEETNARFFVNGKEAAMAPGLVSKYRFGYTRIRGGAAVTIPYADAGLQFVLFVPDERDGLAAMEKTITPSVLSSTAQAPLQEIILHFPEFKLEPERVMLAEHLQAMGMATAFDKPRGSADFSRMAERKPDRYLYLSQVIHQAFIAVDKHGTEAAAATAVAMARAAGAAMNPVKPLEVRVDRPFAFAIQHTESGACLFLGRVTDPR